MNRIVDLAGSLALAGLGVTVAVLAITEPPPKLVYDSIGPMGFPLVLGSALALLGLVQSVRTVRLMTMSGRVGVEEGTPDEPGHPSSTLRALAFIGGFFVYLLLLDPLGFLVVTPPAFFAALSAMRFRTWVGRLVTTVAFTTVGWVVFVQVLSVPLPAGVLADVLLELNLIDYR